MKATRLVIVLLITLSLVIGIAFVLNSAATPALARPEAPAAPSVRANGLISITILHTNDVHGHVDSWSSFGSEYGGSARIATKIKEFRAVQDNVLVLDAGDQFQGTLFYNLFKADIVTVTMNALGYDAMAIGNHEFDDGPDELARLIDGLDFPVIGTNIDASADADLSGKIAPRAVVTVSGEPVGIIGLTTPEAAFLGSAGPDVIFADPVSSAQQAVDELAAQGIDKIIALTHIGYEQDMALAQAVSGLDVIVGGHSHTLLDGIAGPYPTLVNAPDGAPVLVVTANSWNKYLGHLDVTFNATGTISSHAGELILMDDSVALDPDTEAIIATYRSQVEALKTTFIGTSTVEIPNDVSGNRICRIGECALGNLVTDAMLWKINSTNSGEPYQIALVGGGGLRTGIDSGPVSVGEVLEVLPFGNTIATFEITGTWLVEALESGVSRAPEQEGRFPQVSGMRYTWNPNLPPGSRIISVQVYDSDSDSYAPLDEEAVYRVMTDAFLRGGGDGYTVFRDYAINPYDFGPSKAEAVQEYIAQFSPIAPAVEGRIVGTDIVVSPLALSQNVSLDDTDPHTATLTIYNMGHVTHSWSITATTGADWLALDKTSGALAPGLAVLTGTVTLNIPNSVNVVVSFDAAGLMAGTYTTTLVVSGEATAGLPVSVPVTLTVEADPGIFLPLVARNYGGNR